MDNDVKNCPFCGETVRAVAIKCKHCKSDLNVNNSTEKNQVHTDGSLSEVEKIKKIREMTGASLQDALAVVRNESTTSISPTNSTAVNSKATGVFEKFIGILCIIFGVILCFTVIGALFGVPLIIIGATFFFYPNFSWILIGALVLSYKFDWLII